MWDFHKLGKVMENYSENLNRKVNPIIEFRNQAKNIFKSVKMIPLEKIERINKGIIQTEEDLEVFKVAIIELGYPPHEDMDITTMRNIAKSYTSDKESLFQVIDQVMCHYYNNTFLSSMAKKWEYNNQIKDRLPILRNVIMAHNQGMYYVSIPAILSQFEGTLIDTFDIKGIVGGHIIKQLLRGLLVDNSTDDFVNFDDGIYKYYEKNVLVRFNHGDEIESDISRHAILHGGDINYGKQANSIKLILLFDYISEKIKQIDKNIIHNVKEKINRNKRS